MKAKPAICALFLLLLPAAAPGRDGWILPWGDQGDGTYRNPVLKADYSDPDIIRRGDDFYLIASDFHFVGMQILHSRDLVNWTIVGQVFDRLDMDPKYDAMQGYAQGTWAPALGYHDGTFYIFVCTPKDGLFMWHARDMRGPWSKTVTVRAVEGWEDPCPFWDEDGTAYLVRGQVGAGPLILHRMSPDGTRLLDEGREIYRGPVAEGPKLFRRAGTYYISLPEGGVEKGGQTVLRAKDIYGPYERREVLPPGSPHQGGMVTLESGESWFVGFRSTGYLGRICHLLPVRWTEDGWPVFGDGGKTVERHAKPDVGRTYPVRRPETGDEFTARTLSPIWQWNHNPVPAHWSLSARPGWLRLTALPAPSLAAARNTLTQKLWDDAGVVDVRMDAARMSEGQRAGFAFMSGSDFGWIGVEVRDGARRIAWEGGAGPLLRGDRVWLRGIYEGDRGRLLYSLDGRTFAETGAVFQLRFRHWKGGRIAVFSFGPGGGAADFNYIRYRPGPSLEALIAR